MTENPRPKNIPAKSLSLPINKPKVIPDKRRLLREAEQKRQMKGDDQ